MYIDTIWTLMLYKYLNRASMMYDWLQGTTLYSKKNNKRLNSTITFSFLYLHSLNSVYFLKVNLKVNMFNVVALNYFQAIKYSICLIIFSWYLPYRHYQDGYIYTK